MIERKLQVARLRFHCSTQRSSTFDSCPVSHKRETVNEQRCENKSNAAAERSSLAPDLLKEIATDVNTARLALIFDTRRNVNTITEDVVAVDNDVSDVDTDAKSNSRLSTARAALRLAV
jgi:hypothetical protein